MNIPTYQIECKKDGIRQNQDGLMKLTLALHPNDIPAQLYTDPMGQRYMMVLAPIGDDEQPLPVTPKAEKEPRAWKELSPVEQAGILATQSAFQSFAGAINSLVAPAEEHAAQYIRNYCGIQSRRELICTAAAQEKFKELCAKFYDWKNHGVAA